MPIVFLGLTGQQISLEPFDDRVVGVQDSLEFANTVELALRLHPQTQEVVVLYGVSPRDIGFADSARWLSL